MRLSRSNQWILGLALLAAALGGYVQYRSQATPRASITLPGQSAPDLTFQDLDGHSHRLADYRGRPVLLNFWASWCAPCLQEMPALSEAQAKSGGHGAVVLGIAMDDPSRVRHFLAEHPVSYPVLLGRLEAPSTSLQLGDADGVLPYSVLLDADGHMLKAHVGALDPAQLDSWLPASR